MNKFSSLLKRKHDKAFNRLLKQYVLQCFNHALHQQIQPQMGGFIDEESIGLSIISSRATDELLQIKCSIFYIEKIGGCNCDDAPHEENGYFEQWIKLSDGKIEFLAQAFISD